MAIVAVRWHLLLTRYKEGTDITAFIHTMLQYKDELAILGQPLAEDEFSLLILSALGDSWDSFISTIKDPELNNSSAIIYSI